MKYFALLGLVLFFSAITRADHDDGKDFDDIRYKIHFNSSDLAGFHSFLVISKNCVDGEYDENLSIQPKLGGIKLHAKDQPTLDNEIIVPYKGWIPVSIFAFTNAGVSLKASEWLKRNQSNEKTCSEIAQQFAEFIKKDSNVAVLHYTDSPVLANILNLAPCGVHPLKRVGSNLKSITEMVSIRADEISQTGYMLEFDGSETKKLGLKESISLTKEDYAEILGFSGMTTAAADFPATNTAKENDSESTLAVNQPNPSEKSSINRNLNYEQLWYFGLPILSLGILASIAWIRRKKVK